MRKLIGLMAVAVIVLAGIQLTEPVQATGFCSQIEYNQCASLCAAYIPGNCVLTGVTCDHGTGTETQCGCDTFCTISPHDPTGGGYRRFALTNWDGEY